jgi:hypothetical protein
VKLTRAIYPLLAAAAVLVACSSAESDWKDAKAACAKLKKAHAHCEVVKRS